MRISRVIAAALLSLIATGAITACGEASQVNTTVPVNFDKLLEQEPGKSLHDKFGYVPAANLYRNGSEIVGTVYVSCGDTKVAECSTDLHNRGSSDRPNVYVVDGKALALEGPHTSSTDDRSYYVKVPEERYQNFAQLGGEQEKLLGVMPAVMATLGSPSSLKNDPTEAVVDTAIGKVNAFVHRGEPQLP